jgi:hypothetical protein
MMLSGEPAARRQKRGGTPTLAEYCLNPRRPAAPQHLPRRRQRHLRAAQPPQSIPQPAGYPWTVVAILLHHLAPPPSQDLRRQWGLLVKGRGGSLAPGAEGTAAASATIARPTDGPWRPRTTGTLSLPPPQTPWRRPARSASTAAEIRYTAAPAAACAATHGAPTGTLFATSCCFRSEDCRRTAAHIRVPGAISSAGVIT